MEKNIVMIFKSFGLGLIVFIFYTFWLQLILSHITIPTTSQQASLLGVYVIARGFVVFPGGFVSELLDDSTWEFNRDVITNAQIFIALLSVFVWGFVALKMKNVICRCIPLSFNRVGQLIKELLTVLAGALISGFICVFVGVALPCLSGNLLQRSLTVFGNLQLNDVGSTMVKKGFLPINKERK